MKTFIIRFDSRSDMRAFVKNAKKNGWKALDKGPESGGNGSRWAANQRPREERKGVGMYKIQRLFIHNCSDGQQSVEWVSHYEISKGVKGVLLGYDKSEKYATTIPSEILPAVVSELKYVRAKYWVYELDSETGNLSVIRGF